MLRIVFAMGMMLLGAAADDLAKIKAEYAKQDKALNEVYQRIKKGLQPELFEKVQIDQRKWVEYRTYMSDWEARGKDAETSPDRWETAAGLTEARVEWLEAWLKKDNRKGWEGYYSDSYGGHLKIAQKNGKNWFFVEVVRGPTYHSGGLDGEFRINGNTGWFELELEYDGGVTWMTFLKADDGSAQIKVIGENTTLFHGARAYFSGDYLWIGELSEEDRIEVIEGTEYSD
ncbi:lysozyme inhibitor LprI family protein [Luteolibacter sp. AS25]|uniref:lysozyme inhibitor LprI family protein n=1 Tax=Luteolibacter sp. AS25 TaxID=3135776 RepID=UPI00398B72DA